MKHKTPRNKNTVDLYTPSGIGDVYWLLAKLEETAEKKNIKFRVHTPPGPTPQHNRSHFLEYLPYVESARADGIEYSDLKKRAKQYDEIENKMLIECNTWLEAGKRLEHYLPNFNLRYKLNWQISETAKKEVEKILDKNKKNVVIYTSAIKNNASPSTGKTWSYRNWVKIFDALTRIDNINIIWIGAEYDYDIVKYLPGEFKTWVDKPADHVIHLLRNCDKFISYQSGLSCISVSEKIPTYMLYFRKIDRLRFTFCPETSIDNPKLYSAPFFDEVSPNTVATWVRQA